MSRYKVLPLDRWMKAKGRSFSATILYYTEIDPVFHRDGCYLDRQTGTAWFESSGRAFTDLSYKVAFLYRLRLLTLQRLSSEDVPRMERLMNTTSDPALKKLLRQRLAENAELMSFVRIRRSGYITRRRILEKRASLKKEGDCS